MKHLTINYASETTTVKSEAAMWNYLRDVRDSLLKFYQDGIAMGETPNLCSDHAFVTTEDGTPFKEIVFKLNSHGKIEMVNLVKETCRRQVEKARKAAKEAAAKAEAKKARKREADRRYRARKKARLEAQADVAVETTEATIPAVQEA